MIQEILLYTAALFALAIIAVHLVCAAGVVANRVRDAVKHVPPAAPGLPPVSVVVVAKDEERTLPGLLASLDAQSYRRFQTVLLSDRSQDRTLEIMRAYQGRHGRDVKVLQNRRDPVGLGPKQFVLDAAVAQASGEVLLFTDADCTVGPDWVRNMLAYFGDPAVGLVFGQLSLREEGGFLKRFQAFDQPLIHQYNSATAGLGMPGSCFGNNLAARREVIDQVGGFRGLGYTLTEDAALATAVGKTEWKVRVSTRLDTMIQTLPQAGWGQFINQHLRWNGGAFYHEDFATRVLYRFITLYLIASVVAVPPALFFPWLFVLTAGSFISVGLMAFLVGLLYRRDKVRYFLRLVPYTCFFLVFYAFVTALSIFKISPEWKGVRLKAVQPERGGPAGPPAGRSSGAGTT